MRAHHSSTVICLPYREVVQCRGSTLCARTPMGRTSVPAPPPHHCACDSSSIPLSSSLHLQTLGSRLLSARPRVLPLGHWASRLQTLPVSHWASRLQTPGLSFARNVFVLAESIQWLPTSVVASTSAFAGILPVASTALASFNVTAAGVTQNNNTILTGELWFPGALDVDETSSLDVRVLTTLTYDANGLTPFSSTFSLFAFDLTLVRHRRACATCTRRLHVRASLRVDCC
jgi:hypothetical protein